jgi:phage antirepressor YoqD-like protein
MEPVPDLKGVLSARQEPPATEVATLDFHGDGISIVNGPDGTWLVLGQLTANLGLDAQAQQRSLERSAWSKGKTAVTAVMLPGDSRSYPRFLIHERIVPMWLANITTSRIPDPDVRRKVGIYQIELADALYAYVTGRVAAAPALPRSYAEALRELASTVEQRDAAVAELEIAAPAALSWETLASANGDFSVREAAFILNRDPGIGTGQTRLFAILRDLKLVDRNDTPYADHARHVRLRPRTYTNPATDEEVPAKPQVRITAAGLHYLHKRLGGQAPLIHHIQAAHAANELEAQR